MLVVLVLALTSPFLIYRLGMQARQVKVSTPMSQLPPELRSTRRGEAVEAKLIRLVDADTLEVTFTGGENYRVQMLGVDGPEIWTKQERMVDGKMEEIWVESGDQEARNAKEKLENFLAGRRIFLEFETRQSPIDRYGRLLAWVWTEDGAGGRLLLNEWVIREGICEFRKRDEKLRYEELLRDADTEWAERETGEIIED